MTDHGGEEDDERPENGITIDSGNHRKPRTEQQSRRAASEQVIIARVDRGKFTEWR